MTAYRGVGQGLGTCGELVQGFLSDGTSFHITCPIDKGSTVEVVMTPVSDWEFSGNRSDLRKLQTAMRMSAGLVTDQPYRVNFNHWTELDTGKGMASSTADILAGARAVAHALRFTLSPEQEAKIATAIESSDGVMYSGLVAFEQKTGRLVEQFSWYPQFAIVMVIPEHTVLTEHTDFSGKELLGEEFDGILESLRIASEERDAIPFARAATRSSELNQKFNFNRLFERLVEQLPSLGADGINIGHTGTVLGVLYVLPGDESERRSVLAKARHAEEVLSRFEGVSKTFIALTPHSRD